MNALMKELPMSTPKWTLLVPLPPNAQSPSFDDPEVYELVRRIYFARFSRRLVAAGIDAEDGLQACLLHLITRSRMPSRWDPTRGGLSTWLYVAMTGIAINLVDQQRRMLRRSGSVGLGEDVALHVRAVEETEDTP
jgi:DNA-directed RNA polymerase specialized sigma24 family protein